MSRITRKLFTLDAILNHPLANCNPSFLFGSCSIKYPLAVGVQDTQSANAV